MESSAQIIPYLHDCYREDNSRSVLWNILGSGAEHQIFLGGNEELLDGFLEETPLPLNQATPACEAASIDRKEKQVLYTGDGLGAEASLYRSNL